MGLTFFTHLVDGQEQGAWYDADSGIVNVLWRAKVRTSPSLGQPIEQIARQVLEELVRSTPISPNLAREPAVVISMLRV